MAGHSKWAQIKRKKASMDSKRGKIFSKLAKSISVAAKMGGGDPEMNPTLRLAVEKAKAANMPMENIKKAIIKGTGELSGTEYESAIYEGYGPGGAAIMIEVLTDNKNRTVSELRHIMTRHGGTMAEAGSVAWMFHKKGVILVDKRSVDEDLLMDIVLEAGAEDMKNDPEEDVYEITTSVDDFQRVKEAIEDASIKISHAEISMVPTTYVKLEGKDAEQMGKLFDALDDHDDVQNIYTNVDMPE